VIVNKSTNINEMYNHLSP